MSWTAIEDGLRAWVKAGSGLDDAHVVWANQTGARPSGSFITLQLGELIPVGAVDELAAETDLNRAAGTEIELRVQGVREFSVSVQAFTPGVTGDANARTLAAKVQAALMLPSVRDALETAGVSPYDAGTIQSVPALLGTAFEARAVLTARFYTLQTVSEFTGYIDTTEATSYMGPPDSGTKDLIDI